MILLIKGPYLFVFGKETDPAPKYAITLAHMKVVVQHSASRDGQQHLTIETSLGDKEWEMSFEQENIAKQFMEAFKEHAAIGEADEVRKVGCFYIRWFGACTDLSLFLVVHTDLTDSIIMFSPLCIPNVCILIL